MARWTVFGLLWIVLAACRAYGDVGVVLNESLDSSMDRITGSGHSAVYFSRVCADSPVRLRLCHPGEQGSVLSTYTNLGEDQPFAWNVAPLNLYLYGVEDARNRPLLGSAEIKKGLEERYREKYLANDCNTKFCRTSNDAEWRYMVGATLLRGVYIFTLQTTVQQDLDFIERFNAEPNVNHFNGVMRNCADFTMRIINSYFPHATKREYINDFGMTSPKAVARSFTHYGRRHPELRLRILRFPQVPGTIKRSTEVRSGTEQLYHSKKLLVPMAVLVPHEVPLVAASYLLTGRFNPQRESEKYPTADAANTRYQMQLARADNNGELLDELKATEAEERAEAVGTAEEWKGYGAALKSLVDAAVHDEVIPDREYLSRLFKRFDKEGTPVVDSNGAVWLELPDGDGFSRVGLSANNVVGNTSDARLAYQFLLARATFEVKSRAHRRETMRDFRSDWTLLNQARDKQSAETAAANSHLMMARTR